MRRAEKIFCEFAEFEDKAKIQVAHHLIDFKNDF